MNGTLPVSAWSASQQAWLQAMDYVVYLEGGALQAPLPEPSPRAAPPMTVQANGATGARMAPAPRRDVPPDPAPSPAAVEVPRPAVRRGSRLRMPDPLLIALLRASGYNSSDPGAQQLMDSWPLAELRANPAAKRALWPQLRALRRKQRQ